MLVDELAPDDFRRVLAKDLDAPGAKKYAEFFRLVDLGVQQNALSQTDSRVALGETISSDFNGPPIERTSFLRDDAKLAELDKQARREIEVYAVSLLSESKDAIRIFGQYFNVGEQDRTAESIVQHLYPADIEGGDSQLLEQFIELLDGCVSLTELSDHLILKLRDIAVCLAISRDIRFPILRELNGESHKPIVLPTSDHALAKYLIARILGRLSYVYHKKRNCSYASRKSFAFRESC